MTRFFVNAKNGSGSLKIDFRLPECCFLLIHDLVVIARKCHQQLQQAGKQVVNANENAQCRADVAVFAAFNDGANLP